MKILMVIPSLGSGGAERVLSGLANDWVSKKNCTIEIAVLSNSEDFYNINDEIKIHRLNYSSNGSSKIINLIKLTFKLRLLVSKINPDICLSFIRESNIITALAIRGLDTKLVISERDSPTVAVSKLYQILRKKLYPLANGLIVQTNDYKKFVLNEIGDINQKVIPNPVRSINCLNKSKEKIIINVGRLIPVKGQVYLLEAFALCKNAKGWKLCILGDGILKETLMLKAKELGIEDRVIFVGATKNVDEWLCRASIFAFTSLSEGFPNALAEGMSASLACVSFNCVTGPSDLIQDGINGYLVGVRDVSTFANKLDILIKSDSLRERLGGNAKVSTKVLDFEIISQCYFDFLNGILE